MTKKAISSYNDKKNLHTMTKKPQFQRTQHFHIVCTIQYRSVYVPFQAGLFMDRGVKITNPSPDDPRDFLALTNIEKFVRFFPSV